MDILIKIFMATWRLLLESSVYVIFGLLIAGLLRVFLNPARVSEHMGRGRFRSVFKAALLGIPLPLCSCGVLPAAVSLKKQGANTGAVTSFMISTPESGVDSIAITYALLDPIMTVARPVTAFITAAAAGMIENLSGYGSERKLAPPDLSCPVDGCCDGVDCSPEEHRRHHSLTEKIKAGLGFALSDVWMDMASWFMLGLILAGMITAFVPADSLSLYLSGGLSSMLLMLAAGIPLYICATASTPIAAALILKGVSPGAALVFLLAGPATNITSLTVLLGVLGKRATVIYLAAIAAFAVAAGLVVDWIYAALNLNPAAMVGQATEAIPHWLELVAALLLLVLSIKPIVGSLRAWKHRMGGWLSRKSANGMSQTLPNTLPSVDGACASPT